MLNFADADQIGVIGIIDEPGDCPICILRGARDADDARFTARSSGRTRQRWGLASATAGAVLRGALSVVRSTCPQFFPLLQARHESSI